MIRVWIFVVLGMLGIGGVALWVQKDWSWKSPAPVGIPQGQDIFFGKGRCGVCHTLGTVRDAKCPSLGNAGERLTREFIYEAVTKPQAYIRLDYDSPEPKPYPTHMPEVGRPPIGLTEEEIEQVIGFVQRQVATGKEKSGL